MKKQHLLFFAFLASTLFSCNKESDSFDSSDFVGLWEMAYNQQPSGVSIQWEIDNKNNYTVHEQAPWGNSSTDGNMIESIVFTGDKSFEIELRTNGAAFTNKWTGSFSSKNGFRLTANDDWREFKRK